ncbi:hypothetical protein A9Q86_13580 [Flavobacteriales bacterium 33_180_T64]|nr:hypothetical protein A9Q86_13580 [Flavobacteriales bacterium 33_180_T64]
MKAKLLLLLFIIGFNLNTKAQCARSASFQDGDYEVSGTVSLIFTSEGDKMLEIASDFLTMNGPDLHVYLANTSQISTASGNPPETIDLGVLNSVTGSSSYVIPSDINIDDFTYVIIQCKLFNAFWGNAILGTTQGSDCSALSIEERVIDTFSFYPNPAAQSINISGNFKETMTLNIYDSLGSLVANNDNINAQNKTVLLSELTSGIYFVEFISNNKKNIKKLIIN